MKIWICQAGLFGIIMILTSLFSHAYGQALQESELKIEKNRVMSARRGLLFHVLPVSSYEKMIEKNTILIVFSDYMKSTLDKHRQKDGSLSASISDSYEFPAVENFCSLMDTLLQEIPELNVVKAYLTIYQKTQARRWLFIDGSIGGCEKIDRLKYGDVLIFNMK